MKVSEIMNKPVLIDENETLKKAAKTMSDKQIGSLIVTKSNQIIGIVTESDILRNIDKLGEKVSKIASKNLVTIEDNKTIENAAEILSGKKIKRLPVIKSGKVIGIVTATDILAHSDELGEDFFFE